MKNFKYDNDSILYYQNKLINLLKDLKNNQLKNQLNQFEEIVNEYKSMFIIDLADEYFLNKEEIKDPDLLYENSLIFYLLLEDVRNVKDVLVSEKTLLNFTRTRNEDRELKELTKGMLTSLINKNFPFKLLS